MAKVAGVCRPGAVTPDPSGGFAAATDRPPLHPPALLSSPPGVGDVPGPGQVLHAEQPVVGPGRAAEREHEDTADGGS